MYPSCKILQLKRGHVIPDLFFVLYCFFPINAVSDVSGWKICSLFRSDGFETASSDYLYSGSIHQGASKILRQLLGSANLTSSVQSDS